VNGIFSIFPSQSTPAPPRSTGRARATNQTLGGVCVAASIFFHSGSVRADAVTPRAVAGWADVDITPSLGIALGGRGGPETVADKVLDPLHAQVLFLKDGKGTGFVLVSMDVIGVPHDLSDHLRTDLVNELGVEWDLVVLNASHTHSGPYMIRSLIAGVGPAPQIELDYFRFLEEKVVFAARRLPKR